MHTCPEKTVGTVTQIAAHRAGAAQWPENSMTAFRNALMTNVDYIEFDVHCTLDGVLVVHHDAELGRTVDGVGRLSEMNWAELRVCRLREAPAEHVPLLASVLAMFDGSPIRPRLELKADKAGNIYPGMTARVLTMLRVTGLSPRTVISSFDSRYLDEARAGGASELLWLLREDSTKSLFADPVAFADAALKRGIGEVAVRGSEATAEYVMACRNHGLLAGAFAGKDMDFDRLLSIGLSCFTSDRPSLALAAREALPR